MERVFQQNSHFGRFQLKVTAVAVLISLLAAFHILAPIYVLYDPPQFRCRLPEDSGWHANDSLLAQSSEHNASILQFQPELDANDTNLRQHRCFIRVNDSLQACSDWVFDTEEFDSTLVTELGLVCDNSHWATVISTCSFAGILVGIVLSGLLADWLGRRVTLIVTMWLLTGAQLAGLFAVSVAYTAAVRFFVGLGALSSSTVVYVMILELVGSRARHHVTAAFGYGWSVGTAIVALVAYLTRSWRNYAIASLVPTVALLLLVHLPCMAPETPRWLLSRGRKRAAGRIVRQMLLDNGRTGEQASAAVKELLGGSGAEEDDGKTAASDGRHSMRRSLGLLARSPRLLLRYGIIGIDWFLVAAIYYGISMGAKNLPGSIFVTSCLIGIVDLPSYLIMHLAADRLGRKTTFIGAIGGSGLALVGLAIANHLAKDLTWLVIALSLLGKMLNSTAFAIIYIWTGELYATNMRSSGLSTSSMCARFGTLFAPLLGNIRDFIPGEFGPLVSYAVFAGSSFLAAAISFAVPETRGVAIPDSVEDLINTNRLEAVEAEEAGAAGADLLAKEEKT
ncbi:hypothetical protein BOX15_Mlig006318g1 [Macrostomum lignano]|uniref:Major facilitator superfamily (MFS) profile domain-containing protein n=1 Tax=Macrostomum lignano TaxID=282301 RepID=A0A267GEP7_9PLAT|nr:hypothetical protein BOX15_Mlig006318g1 [Macrostomum lignano]